MKTKYPSRRDVLMTAATLAAGASVPAMTGGRALAAAEPALNNSLEEVDQALRQAVNARTVPGIVAIGANDRGIVYEGAFGPNVTADSLFWIASMTKAITATAAMQLVEQGKLQLDEPIGKLLPDLQSPKVLEGFDASGAPKLRPAKRPITLRHLLTHTAGFTYAIWSANLTRYQKVTGLPDVGTCKYASLLAPLEFDPGDRWEYGINMDWVGKAVEAVSDQSLEVYFREHIFAPLGMNDSGFLISTPQKARVTQMYKRRQDGSLEPMAFEMPQRPEFFMGGGALFSTPRNYIAFTQMLLHDGTFNGARVLKPETVALMRQNNMGDLNVTTLKTVQPDLSNDANLFPGMVQKWGLSFDINTQPGPAGRSAGSIAWAGLFNTYFWVDPNQKVTGVIMSQLLPFADAHVLDLFAKFESGLYRAVTPA
ncbi:serine hydrolase [Rhodopila globiformis]|uniref:Serine hydrolase n=2 Tax=Rhodopila globiformis TaxID=1071 RepID=A0A2S6NMI4_RHOGL|nr:serine hydrolase [Rhodopila globiformis]